MTTTTPTAVPTPSGTSATSAAPFTGLGTLLRLYLRLDRVRITVWTLALAFTVWSTVLSLAAVYPDEASRQARAALLENPAAVLMTGPAYGIDNYTLGAMTANELSLTVFVATAIMSILLVVRHTRAQEESGRLELLRALPVGAYAPPAAALMLVSVANLIVGTGITVALIAGGLDVVGSVAFGVASAVTGVLFGAVAAVTAQFGEHSRSATGTALAVLAAAFFVRGAGDIIESTGSWLSWLSPIAWAQQTRLYVDERWWPLLLSVATTVVLLTVAVALSRRRDLGAGLRAPKPGPAEANSALLGPVGLIRRLLRGAFVGWLTGLVLFGVAMGALASSVEDLIDEMPQVLDMVGVDPDALTASFSGMMLMFLALGATAFGVSGVMRMRSEEDGGRSGLVIVTGTARSAWLFAALGVIVVQLVVALLVSGAATGLGVALAVGDWGWMPRMIAASLAYAPAAILVVAVAFALLGCVPRATGLVWVLVVWMVFVAWLGEMLNLPDELVALSPFSHIPLVPAEGVTVMPLIIQAVAAVLLVAAAIVGFRRRDVQV
ncbi:ABC transporter permease [Rhodococcus pyridinivorans]|uniref:ABC transporter permease n=1 Tax=Rhodococcus pyridinivorans TaxID=103816 RepID=UPI00051A4D97|nr:polyketide antibiotic transporter [Rhodococcus pyridinivorans]